jgi:uncharacterized protein YndB with AHSA1/START domain
LPNYSLGFGYDAPMQQVEVQRVYPSAPESVWALYTDHLAWARFVGSRVHLQPQGSPSPNGVGCVRHFSVAGREIVAEEITVFEAPTHLKYHIVKGGWPLRGHQGEVFFAPQGQGTLVTWRCQFRSAIPGLGLLLRLFIIMTFRQVLRRVAAELAPA